VAAECGLELRDFRHHEAKLGAWIGEFALQIQKIRVRNMTGLVGMASRYDVIGYVAALSRRFEIGRAIEQPQIRLVDDVSEFRRCD